MCAKLMVIGLDGLSLEMLLPLVKGNQLPTFAHVLQSSAYGILRSVSNMATGPTWASFATGCLPSQHGVFHDFHHHADRYALSPTQGKDRQKPAFWELASEAGRRVIVLNVPMTYPVNAVHGAILAGIDAPSERASGFAYPADLYQDLRRNGIDYLIDCGLASYMQMGDISGGMAALQHEIEVRTAAAEYLMRQQDWDLLVVIYSLPDVWQHYYWTTPERSEGRALLYDGYRTMDRHLARLLVHLPADGCLLICSDHGFGPLQGTRDFLNDWLAEQKLLTYATGTSASLVQKCASYLMGQIRTSVSFRRRQQLLASIPSLRRFVETRLRIGKVDWAHTQAYAAIDHQEIWINVQGRQPQGTVPPHQYEAVCTQIRELLYGWCDPEGVPYLDAIELSGDEQVLFPAFLLPDLVLTWNRSATPPRLHPLITGDHMPEGTLIIAGKGIRPGMLTPHSLTDVAPLALHLLDVPVPASMDGVVPQIFERNP